MLRGADASKSRLGGPVKGHEAIRRIAAFKKVAFLWRTPDGVAHNMSTCLFGARGCASQEAEKNGDLYSAITAALLNVARILS